MRCCLQPGCPVLVARGYCQTHAAERERARPNADVRKWYHTARWQRLRLQVQQEQPLCDDCADEGRVESGTDVDHTIPHRGDPVLFWNRSNLRNKCHRHHSQKTARGE